MMPDWCIEMLVNQTDQNNLLEFLFEPNYAGDANTFPAIVLACLCH